MIITILRLIAWVFLWDVGLFGINALNIDSTVKMNLFALYIFAFLEGLIR